MEPITISLVVAALVAKAAERAQDKALDGAEGALGALASRVRKLFADSHDASGSRTLELVEAVPDSDAKKQELADAIRRHIEGTPSLADEFADLVQQAEDAGADVEMVRQSIRGDHNIQVGRAGGDVNIGSNRGS